MPLHVLRTTRKRCGLSQSKLAAMVGTSLTAIKQIETGRLQPSAKLGPTAFICKLASIQDKLIENSFPDTPFHPMGMEVSKELFEGLRQGRREHYEDKEHVEESLRQYGAVLEILLDVSTKEGKLWALRPALQNAITKLIADFELQDDFARHLSACYGIKGSLGEYQSEHKSVHPGQRRIVRQTAQNRGGQAPGILQAASSQERQNPTANPMSLDEIIEELPKLSHQERRELGLRPASPLNLRTTWRCAIRAQRKDSRCSTNWN